MTIGERIRKRREELGMSQDELAHKLGYKSRSSVNKIELGLQNLTQTKIKAIADELMTTPLYIMGWDEADFPDIGGIERLPDNIFPITTKRIPLLGDIACGEPIYANEDHESSVLAGSDIRADFCLRAKGDSMKNARILDGDIVFIKRCDTVDNGQIAAVIIGDEATLKRVYYYREKNMLILRPENPEFEDLVYDDDELDSIKIIGRAVAFQSDIK